MQIKRNRRFQFSGREESSNVIDNKCHYNNNVSYYICRVYTGKCLKANEEYNQFIADLYVKQNKGIQPVYPLQGETP